MPDPLAGTDLISLGAIWHTRMQDGDHWTDRRGIEWPIEQMPPSHRENVRRYLRRHCARLQHVTSLYALAKVEPIDADPAFPDDDLYWMLPQTPLEWLYGQPLFKALVAADM